MRIQCQEFSIFLIISRVGDPNPNPHPNPKESKNADPMPGIFHLLNYIQGWGSESKPNLNPKGSKRFEGSESESE